MKAIRYYAYGSPEVLKLQDVDKPEVGDREGFDTTMIRDNNTGIVIGKEGWT
ncbi:hypothetical protein ITP53_12240 [Nonomuraea sp. K274]|uniref:Uncharacterized protein n=1 Tax=Nonomuraea cypriaca TaxID=1187855 RepID=A0A931A5B6_9ACTN|nr:hypothetical protein [Nonomuraea cypriaca]MBF8186496.1 hypothetical protein [Nonomuraea cypriaca]